MQQPMPGPGASLEEHVNYDPFEALAVEWDRQGHSTDTSHDLVGTWEIEVSACLAALPTCKTPLCLHGAVIPLGAAWPGTSQQIAAIAQSYCP